MINPTADQVENYIIKHKARGHMTVKVLSKLNPFIRAMETELGQQLLQDDIDRHEILLEKVYEENITPEEAAEFRYLKRRLKIISERITTYTKGVEEITKGE